MADKLYSEAAVRDIAAAIREKNGSNTKYAIGQMGAAVRAISTGLKTEVYTYNQCRPEVESYLKNVTYDPADYTVSRIADYVKTTSANRPVGVSITMKSAGMLTIVDGYTGNSVSQPVSAGAITVYNCTPGATSKFVLTDSGGNIVQQGVIKPTGTCRMINMLNVDNVRDLGGWSCDGGTVKYGKLFRGGEMYGYLTDDGRRQAIDMLGILKEIDLRFESDLNGRTESGFGGPVEMLWVDMTWNDLSYQKESGNIKAIFDSLFDYVIADQPTYFHCSAGADRTGVVALVCEAVLGMSQSDIDKDYELTNFFSGVSTDALARRRNEQVWTREINYINTYSGATFRDKVVSLLLSCGITIDKINAFRAAMIDGTPAALSAEIATYSVTKTLTDVTVSNGAASVQQYQPFVAEIAPAAGKLIESIKVTMGGKDVTAAVLRGNTDVLRRAVRAALTKCTSSNKRVYAIDGQSYVTAINADVGHEVSSVKIMMGGVDVSAYYKDGIISIPEVTGDIVITAKAVAQAPKYTNVVLAAVNDKGASMPYQDNYNLSSSGAPQSDNDGHVTTGFIPLAGNVTNHVYRIAGSGIEFSKSDTFSRVAWYDANFALLKAVMPAERIDSSQWFPVSIEEANTAMTFRPTESSTNVPTSAAYFRVSAKGKGANLIITLDEPIE